MQKIKIKKTKVPSDKSQRLDRTLKGHTRLLMWSLVGILFIVLISVVSGAERKNIVPLVRQITGEATKEVFTQPKKDSFLKKLITPKPLLQKKDLEKEVFETKVPILMYHYIGSMESSFNEVRRGLTVTPEVFRIQMKWLKDNGFVTVTLSQYFELVLKKEKINPKTIIITFDDGYKNVYDNAIPVMQEYEQTAVLFIIANSSGSVYMGLDEIKSLDEAGFEIGSHSLTHPNLTDLSGEGAKNEIKESKNVLEKNLGHPVNFFCYPYGNYNWGTVDIVRGAGYKGALTTGNGSIVSNNNIFRMPRLRITDIMGEEGFANMINSVLK